MQLRKISEYTHPEIKPQLLNHWTEAIAQPEELCTLGNNPKEGLTSEIWGQQNVDVLDCLFILVHSME